VTKGSPALPAVYDEIGRGYVRHRRADPRIAQAIQDGLHDAVTVLDVGAGAGNYEPADRSVIAVEPSELMLATRTQNAAPAARATAEALPIRTQAFDAALVVLSLHHWTNWRAGLAELTRVSRRQVLFTFDPTIHHQFWLIQDYFPAIARLPTNQPPSPREIAEALGGAQIIDVPVPSDCQDGFLWAYFNRPGPSLIPASKPATHLWPC